MNFTLAGVRAGAQRFAPLAVSVFAYGMVFGMLARQAGLSLTASAAMSLLVAAGSSQFVAIGMWHAPLPVVSILVTTLVVNLRNVLMGAAIRPYLAALPARLRYSMLYVMGDENWALTMREFEQGGRDSGFFLGSGALSLAAWVSSTVAGYLAASAIPDPASFGLDFAFTAVFLALLVGTWKGRTSLLPVIVAAVTSLIAGHALEGKWYILIGGLAGSLTGAWRDGT
ncbi:MAG: AzlC family ABC transporter permease [bacterium]